MAPTRNNNPAISETLKKVTPVVRRASPVTEAQQRQPFRVLQTSHAPAQLSLFLRPANAR